MSGPLPVLHGPTYAAYVKVARLVMEEKRVPYRHAHFDFPHRPDGFETLNPFGKVPVLQHGDFVLYETVAIARYIDEGFDGPPLQPADARDRARMAQIISMMDQVGAPTLLRTIYTERRKQHVLRLSHDEAAVLKARVIAVRCLDVLRAWLGDRAYMVGDEVSLADAFVFPTLAYFVDSQDGEDLIRPYPELLNWLARLRTRAAFAAVGLPELPRPIPNAQTFQ